MSETSFIAMSMKVKMIIDINNNPQIELIDMFNCKYVASLYYVGGIKFKYKSDEYDFGGIFESIANIVDDITINLLIDNGISIAVDKTEYQKRHGVYCDDVQRFANLLNGASVSQYSKQYELYTKLTGA